ncbi:hypothetical protein [Prevotella denticola]|nr:hypothetical protein [Prevotella denticola]
MYRSRLPSLSASHRTACRPLEMRLRQHVGPGGILSGIACIATKA